MIGVLKILSQLLGGLAIALLVPAAIGAMAGEFSTARMFLIVAAIVAFFAGAVFFALQGRGRRLSRTDGFILVVAVWVVPPLFAALPLMEASGTDYVTALFEAASGYTTTGASALPTLEPLGRAGVFFRAELQWLGGLMTLLTIVTVIAPSGLGGGSDRSLALLADSGDRFARIWSIIRYVLLAYGAVTVLCIFLLFLSGIDPFDAFCLALSTVSTGGFMPIDGTLADYGNRFAELVIMVFMLIGATSIIWHRVMLEGRWQLLGQHGESYWVVGGALVVGIAYAFAFAAGSGAITVYSVFDSFSDGLVTGVSLVSTTGFELRGGGLAALPATVVIIVAIIGGGSISTAGGMKYYRVGAMFIQSRQELKRLVYPHSVHGKRFGASAYDLEFMRAVWSNLTVVAVTIIMSTLLLGLALPTYDGALTAAVAAFSNIGPLYSAGWVDAAGWPSYAEFDGLAKIVTIATMILGRVEVLVLLGAVNLAYWRS